jgi:ubiquinone/menaquinone biosynthesis C-methylase UbiE
MSVSSHLGIDVAEYDRRILTFIPHYEEMLDQAAHAVATSSRRPEVVVDLGTGSGALASRVVKATGVSRVIGIDADADMLGVAWRRLRGRLTPVVGDFESTPIPDCDAIIASFSLHHVPTAARKARVYRRCHRALRAGGVLINADCCLSSSARRQSVDRDAWIAHLARSYGRKQARAHLRAWAGEDHYLPLNEEYDLLKKAGFLVDLSWRQDCFAVIAATKPG